MWKSEILKVSKSFNVSLVSHLSIKWICSQNCWLNQNPFPDIFSCSGIYAKQGCTFHRQTGWYLGNYCLNRDGYLLIRNTDCTLTCVSYSRNLFKLITNENARIIEGTSHDRHFGTTEVDMKLIKFSIDINDCFLLTCILTQVSQQPLPVWCLLIQSGRFGQMEAVSVPGRGKSTKI